MKQQSAFLSELTSFESISDLAKSSELIRREVNPNCCCDREIGVEAISPSCFGPTVNAAAIVTHRANADIVTKLDGTFMMIIGLNMKFVEEGCRLDSESLRWLFKKKNWSINIINCVVTICVTRKWKA